MKYLLIGLAVISMRHCVPSYERRGLPPPESVHYKMFLEDNGVLSSSSADVTVDILPVMDGFYRIQHLTGPGISITDSLLLSRKGLPKRHIYRREGVRSEVIYHQDQVTIHSGDEELEIPIVGEFMFDITQIDLAMKGLDSLKVRTDVPFFLPTTQDVTFLELAEIRKDSINAYYVPSDSLTEKIPVIHRYAVAPGVIFEGWYRDDRMLPVKMRITKSGGTHVFYDAGDGKLPWE